MSSANGAAIDLFLSVERLKFPALGRAGGLPGAAGRITLRGQDGDIPGKGQVRVSGADHLIFETPGGGGLGPPAERDRTAVARDLAWGLVSHEGAKNYGDE